MTPLWPGPGAGQTRRRVDLHRLVPRTVQHLNASVKRSCWCRHGNASVSFARMRAQSPITKGQSRHTRESGEEWPDAVGHREPAQQIALISIGLRGLFRGVRKTQASPQTTATSGTSSHQRHLAAHPTERRIRSLVWHKGTGVGFWNSGDTRANSRQAICGVGLEEGVRRPALFAGTKLTRPACLTWLGTCRLKSKPQTNSE